MDKMICFNKVSKKYNQTYALRDVDITIPKGQFCVILGPSGAGKSTLLRMANGLVWPSEGAIVFNDASLTKRNVRFVRSRTAMIHQQFNLTGRLSVLDNILCGALPRVSAFLAAFKCFPLEYRRKACMLLERVGLGEEHLYRRAMQLSGGQQQRVAIARAFILDPDLVLADEPVASLDPKISVDILELLKRSSRRFGSTVLCSLHQVDFARRFADRIIGMRGGRIVFDGVPSELTNGMLRAIYSGDADGGPASRLSDSPQDTTAPAARDMEVVF